MVMSAAAGNSGDENNQVQAHHEQLSLCTNRLAYRQGRRLTAVKVYTINNESNHLLVFGVPSLKLRQEAKALFTEYGNLLHFAVSTEHPGEVFTETFHAKYDRIQSARIAKKMIDTRNFYGGSLHVCYAPEFETVAETKAKLMQRRKDVRFRLRNLQKEESQDKTVDKSHEDTTNIGKSTISSNINKSSRKLNMGDTNIIFLNKKRKKALVKEKIIRPFFENTLEIQPSGEMQLTNDVEIIDCTSIETEVLTNLNEALNYNNFGSEVIKKVEQKPLNRVIFNRNKKT